jgi:quercetin dioxygenase-like cupin family protein
MRTSVCMPSARVGALLASLVAGSLGPSGAVQATPPFQFASDVASAPGVAEINIKSLSPTHKVRLNTLGGGPSDVYVAVNTVAPGGHSGWHTHPGPSFVMVKSGTVTVYDGEDLTCTGRVIEQGGWFIDAGRGHVHLVRNETPANLVLVAFQIVPAGEARRIDVLAGDVLAPCGF